MSLDDFRAWKNGQNVDKYYKVIQFWRTEPTEEQVLLSYEISKTVMTVGFILGMTMGIVIGAYIYYVHTVI